MITSNEELLKLRDRLRLFAVDRNWDQFHSPKNLAAESNQIKCILINSLKNFEIKKPELKKASPKRILRKLGSN